MSLFLKTFQELSSQHNAEEHLLRTMITLSNQSRLQIPKFGKTVYTLWSEIEMMIKKVRRDRSSRQRCSIKKLLIKISQYSQENTYVGFVAGLISCNFIKKRLQHKCFPASIVKFLRIAFLWNTSGGCFCLLEPS